MEAGTIAGALVMALVAVPGVAKTDNPYDPQMCTQAARERDARDAQAWAAWKADKWPKRQGSDANADRAYADAREDYELRIAKWLRAAAACRAGR